MCRYSVNRGRISPVRSFARPGRRQAGRDLTDKILRNLSVAVWQQHPFERKYPITAHGTASVPKQGEIPDADTIPI